MEGKDNEECNLCVSGTYSEAAATECSQCPQGTYADSVGLSQCIPCAMSYYNDESGKSTCKRCQSNNTLTLQQGSVALDQCVCSASFYGNFSKCTRCPSNSDSMVASTSVDACTCNVGYTGSKGQCTACGAGTYYVNASCIQCRVGTYSTALATSNPDTCTNCSVGTYATGLGSASSAGCAKCVAGTFSTALAAQDNSTCFRCFSGSYSSALAAPNSSSCTACAAGTYATGNGAASSAACTKCLAGMFSTGTGMVSSSVCAYCNEGSFSDTAGMSSCTNCSAGTYSGTYGLASSTGCIKCPVSTYSTAVGATSDMTCTLCFSSSYTVAAGAQTIAACVCPIATYRNGSTGTLEIMSLGRYTFGNGRNLDDVSGGIGPLTTTNNPTFSATCAPTNQPCVQISSTSYLTMPSFTLITPGFTICTSLMFTAFTSWNIIYDFENSGRANILMLHVMGGQFRWAVNENGAWGTLQFGPTVQLNNKYHVCISYQNSVSNVYINGIQYGALTFTLKFVTRTMNRIGNDIPLSGGFIGNMFEMEIFNEALTSQQIVSMYQGGRPLLSSNVQVSSQTSADEYVGCLPCAIGYYSTSVGAVTSSKCMQCAAGTYSSVSAATVCLNCVAGTYSSALASVSIDTCTNCSVGQYSSAQGAPSSASCAQCAIGQYSNVTGAFMCKQCHPQAVTAAVGSTSASQCFCSANHYGDGMHCTPCTSGSAAPSGSTNAFNCQCMYDFFRDPKMFTSVAFTNPTLYYMENNNGLRRLLLETQQCGNVGSINTPFGPVFGMGIVNNAMYYGGQNRVEIARVDLDSQVQTVQNLPETSRWLFPHVDGNLYFASSANYIKRVNATASSYSNPTTVSAATGTVQSFVVTLNASTAFVFEAAYLYKHLLTTPQSKSVWVGTGTTTPTVNYFAEVPGLSFSTGAAVYGAALDPEETYLYYVVATSGSTASYLVRTNTQNRFTITLKNTGATTVYGVVLYNDVLYYSSSSATLYYYNLLDNDANPSLPNTNVLDACGGVNVFWGLALAAPITQSEERLTCPACATCDGNAIKINRCFGNSSYDTSSCLCKPLYYGNGIKCTKCSRCSVNAETFQTCSVNETRDVSNCSCYANYYGDGLTCAACAPNSTSALGSLNETDCICNNGSYKIPGDTSKPSDNMEYPWLYIGVVNSVVSKYYLQSTTCITTSANMNIYADIDSIHTADNDQKIYMSFRNDRKFRAHDIATSTTSWVVFTDIIKKMWAGILGNLYFVFTGSPVLYRILKTQTLDQTNRVAVTSTFKDNLPVYTFVLDQNEQWAYVALQSANQNQMTIWKHKVGDTSAGVFLAGGGTTITSLTETDGSSMALGTLVYQLVLAEEDSYLYVIPHNSNVAAYISRVHTMTGMTKTIKYIGVLNTVGAVIRKNILYFLSYTYAKIYYYDLNVEDPSPLTANSPSLPQTCYVPTPVGGLSIPVNEKLMDDNRYFYTMLLDRGLLRFNENFGRNELVAGSATSASANTAATFNNAGTVTGMALSLNNRYVFVAYALSPIISVLDMKISSYTRITFSLQVNSLTMGANGNLYMAFLNSKIFRIASGSPVSQSSLVSATPSLTGNPSTFILSSNEKYAFVSIAATSSTQILLYKYELDSGNAGILLAGGGSTTFSMTPLPGTTFALGYQVFQLALSDDDAYIYVLPAMVGAAAYMSRVDTKTGETVTIKYLGPSYVSGALFFNNKIYYTAYSNRLIHVYDLNVDDPNPLTANTQTITSPALLVAVMGLAISWLPRPPTCALCKTCDINAVRTGTCTPTADNYNCTCMDTYFGDGFTCFQCPANSYCTNGVKTTCPTNSRSAAGASACICNDKYYGDWRSCTLCSANSFCVNGTSFPCPEHTTSANGSASCVCSGGYEGPMQDSCAACSAGKFSQTNTSCMNCSQGFYSNTTASSSCSPCPLGYYNAISGMSECFLCPANHWCAAGTSNQCPQHAHSAPGSSSQHSCLCDAGYAGDGSLAGTSPCALCSANYYCPGGNSNLSIACGVHRHSAPGSASSLDCICNEGFVEIDAVCTCPEGSYCPSESALPCPANSSSPAGSTSVAQCTCDAGFHGIAAEGCLACGIGFFCPGDTTAIACTGNATTAGSYSAFAHECFCDRGFLGVNNTPCQPCPLNNWCWTGVANACPAHAQAPMFANYMENCTCVPGYYGDDGGPCYICPFDQFCPGRNATIPCPPYSASALGSAQLSDCVCFDGFVFDSGLCYCNPGTKLVDGECVPCDANVYCWRDEETLCPAHSTAPPLSSTVSDCACDSGYARVNNTCVACEPGTYELHDECVACPVGTYSDNYASASCFGCSGYANTTDVGSAFASNCTCNEGWWGDGLLCQLCTPCAVMATLTTACDRLAVPETTQCTCQVGYAGSGFECSACALGHVCSNNTDTVCPNGYYQDEYNETECKPCPLGTYGNGSGATACLTCFAGLKVNATIDGVLQEIYTTQGVATLSVFNCSCGDLPIQEDGSCADNCPGGYFWDLAKGECAVCAQGSYCIDNVQTACPPFFSAPPNSSECSPCIGPDTHTSVALATCGLLSCPPQELVHLSSAVSGVGKFTITNDQCTFDLDPANDRPIATLYVRVNLSASNFLTMQVEGTGTLTLGLLNSTVLASKVFVAQAATSFQTKFFYDGSPLTTLYVRAESLVTRNSLTVRALHVHHLQAWAPLTALTLAPNNMYWLTGNISTLAATRPDNAYAVEFVSTDPVSVFYEVLGDWVPADENFTSTSVRQFMFTALESTTRIRIVAAGALISTPELKYADQPCKQCFASYFCAADLLVPCPPLSHSDPGAPACTCDDGYFGAPCALCPANFVCVNGTKLPCPLGSKAPPGSAACEPCDTNEYCKDGQVNPCLPHARPVNWPRDSVYGCTCDPGFWTPLCVECDPGHYCAGGEDKTPCPAGTYTTVTNATAFSDCALCPPGHFSSPGSTSCTPCAPGTFSADGALVSQAHCQQCLVGSVCEGGDRISPCAPGSWSNSSGLASQSQCSACPPGFFCSGGYAVQLCPLGTYSPFPNVSARASCPLCPPGSYCPGPLSIIACPENTNAPPGTHDLAGCLCNPGFQCTFQNVIHAEVILPVTVEGFELIRDVYIAAVAAAASVDPAQVRIISITPVAPSGRRLLARELFAEVHVSIAPARHASIQHVYKGMQQLDAFLRPRGLYALATNVLVHKEIVSAVR